MTLSLSYNYKPTYVLNEAVVPKLKFILLHTLDHNVPADSNLQTSELQQMLVKLKQSHIQQNSLIQAIQVIFALLSSTTQQSIVKNEHYLELQSLIQKQEAINRKHIKLEQQMQIYLQSLQEKIQELEDKLQIESNKNKWIIEKNKMIQHQLNTLKSYKSKHSLKEKVLLDKMAARAEKISNQKLQHRLFFKQPSIKREENQVKNQPRSKIWLHDRNVRKKHVSEEALLKNISHSVHAVINERRKLTYLSSKKVASPLKVRKILQRSSFSHLS